MALRQHDMFVDASDAVIVKDAAHLKAIIDALPPDTPMLRAFDITSATGMSPQSISALRDQGAFTAFNLGTKAEPRYRYHRASFLAWLKSRMMEGEF